MRTIMLSSAAAVAVAGVAGVASPATAQQTTTATGQATVTFEALPPRITQNAPLRFGTIQLTSGSGDTVQITPDDINEGGRGPASFEVSSPTFSSAQVRIVESSITLAPQDGPAPPSDVTVSDLAALPETLNVTNQGTEFRVGGTLRYPDRMTPGSYSGDFTVELTYQ